MIHFALRFTYSLDFFGSFLDQAKNEQVEIRITTGESDFGGIVAKKKQQYRQNQGVRIPIFRGLVSSVTKMTLLRSLGSLNSVFFVLVFDVLI